MPSHMKARHWGVVATVLFALCAPAAAAAGIEPPPSLMAEPSHIGLNTQHVGLFLDEKIFGVGIEPGEPATFGSGSLCRPAGYVDYAPPGVEEHGFNWTLKATNWYSFTGTGGPVVLRADGANFVGVVLYQDEPTVEDALGCARIEGPAPPRFELDTEAGSTYLLQVGDWRYLGQTDNKIDYVVSLASITANGDRSRAMAMPLGTPVRTSNFGGALDSDPPSCAADGATYLAGRSAWAKVDVPSTGTLGMRLEREEAEPPALTMIALYRQGGDVPVACGVGPVDSVSSTTELSAPVAAGSYWLQFATAVKSSKERFESAEQHWRVAASFSPNLDIDGDGYSRPGDCRDDSAAIHPDAVDSPDNGVDENCDGQDAKRDTDGDGVPDYRDRCPTRSNAGVDSNEDGCRDPQQVPLTAQVRLALNGDRLHVVSLFVRTDPGARVVLSCGKGACKGEAKRVRGARTRFDSTFRESIPDGTEISIAATEAGSIGVTKLYRLSTAGIRVLRQSCTQPGRAGRSVPCE